MEKIQNRQKRLENLKKFRKEVQSLSEKKETKAFLSLISKLEPPFVDTPCRILIEKKVGEEKATLRVLSPVN